MTISVPPLEKNVQDAFAALKASDTVKKALDLALAEVDHALKEQVELCEIPAPTFDEGKRAAALVERFKAYGLKDVAIDEIGNVIGRRPGKGKGPVLVLASHMDTVFPADTDVTVKIEGTRYTAPGIGDNCSGLRAILQVLRCFNTLNIQTEGDLWFVGTVGEEGNGDIRGSKYLCAHYPIDGFIAVDGTNINRVLKGATGSHRWLLSVDGPGGHSFLRFGKNPSAIHAVCIAGARVAHIKVPESPKTTFTIGTISGGTTVNAIAAHCEVQVDMRSVDNKELLKLESAILTAFEDAVEEENAIWDVTDEALKLKLTKTQIGMRPAGMRPDTCPVLQCSRAAQEVLGIELTQYDMASTDANAPMSCDIPATCLGSGGKDVGEHSLKEYFEAIDTHLGPQLVFLAAAALVGIEGNAPLLTVRKKA